MSVVVPRGFVASGVAAGIKPAGELDLALVATEDARAVATGAVFTSNLLPAAPVQVSRAHLAKTGAMAAAVVLNSGCANAATGARGVVDAERTAELSARALEVPQAHVLVCSTGTIGTPLDMAAVERAIPELVAAPILCTRARRGSC